MGTNKMREQFEAWHFSEVNRLAETAGAEAAARFNESREDRWPCWQASREAVVVELPAKGKPDADDVAGWCLTRNSTIDACRRVIEAQGLKVAP